jgi:hypothetical protein
MLASSSPSRIIQGIPYKADQLIGKMSCPLIAFLNTLPFWTNQFMSIPTGNFDRYVLGDSAMVSLLA